jgi:hypothetical protein
VAAWTLFTPILQLLVFGDGDGFFDEFDVLGDLRFDVGEFEFVSAVETGSKFEWIDFVDQFGGDGVLNVLFVTGLGSLFAFRFASGLVFGRSNDVGGGKFEGVGGVLFENGDCRLERGDLFKSGLELCVEFGAFVCLWNP